MNVQNSYDQWSSTYDSDRNLTRDLDGVVTQRVLGGLACGTILELGCGTGKNTEFLATIGRQVLALDFSEGMIARARQKVRLENVSFRQADLTKPWPVADGSVDAVVGNLVVEHISDLTFIFAEAARVLRLSGKAFLCELHPFRQYQGAAARFGQGLLTCEIPAFVHHISDFLTAAENSGFTLSSLQEWWHAEDDGKPPRLLSLLWEKSTG